MTTVLRRRGSLARVLVAAVASVSLLASCGDEGAERATEEDSPSASPSPDESETPEPEEPTEPVEPECSSVWVAGQELPKRYQGCFDAEKGRWQEAMVYRCSSGQRLVTYRRNFYAAKGEVVNETPGPLAKDENFKKAMAACGA